MFLRWHHGNWSAFVRAQWLTQPYDNKTGAEGTPYNAPTQNAVDMYERKGADGNYYPITDPRSGYDAVKTTNLTRIETLASLIISSCPVSNGGRIYRVFPII